MYPEIVNGKLDDSYIDIFLGLLLKLGQLREDDYSYMFGKDLNSHNINLQTQKIRELYKKEVLKLKYAGKNANQSKLPWISKAKKLFENTIDWDNETLEKELMSEVYLNDSSLLQPLPQTYTFSSSKIAMVSPMSTSSVSPTGSIYLPLAANPFSVANSKPCAARSLLKTTVPSRSSNSVSKTAKKRTEREIAKIYSVSSPFTMDPISTEIRHQFYPPTSITPAVPYVPPWTIPLKSYTEITSAQSSQPSNVISSIQGDIPTSSTHLLSTLPSSAEVSLDVTNWSTQDPCMTTFTYSGNKNPTFTDAESSSAQFPPRSYIREVPLSSIASFYKKATPLPKTTMTPNSRVLLTNASPLTSEPSLRLHSYPSSYSDSIPKSFAQPSKTRDSFGLYQNPSHYCDSTPKSADMPSKPGYHLHSYSPPESVEVPLYSAARSSSSSAVTSKAHVSFNYSHQQSVPAVSDVSSGMNRLSLSSRADVQKSTVLYSGVSVFDSATLPDNAGAFYISSTYTSDVPSIRESVLTSAVPSSRTSEPAPSRSRVLASTADILHNSSHPAHRPTFLLASELSSWRNSLSLSSRADVQKSTASSSSALTSVAPFIRDSAVTSAVLSTGTSAFESDVSPSSKMEAIYENVTFPSRTSTTPHREIAYF